MPNLSMTNVKSLGNIGADARKTLLADAHMKVGEEKDDIIWAFDRGATSSKPSSLKPRMNGETASNASKYHTTSPRSFRMTGPREFQN